MTISPSWMDSRISRSVRIKRRPLPGRTPKPWASTPARPAERLARQFNEHPVILNPDRVSLEAMIFHQLTIDSDLLGLAFCRADRDHELPRVEPVLNLLDGNLRHQCSPGL